MTVLEIVLLLIGIICVAVSFIFFLTVDGPEAAAAVNLELTDRQKEDIKKQISQAYQEQMDEMTDSVCEQTELALEKLSNQKIQELSDYSDTVLEEINKNHTEVMFLYDMLNEKSKEVHNNIRDISLAAEQLNEARERAEDVIAESISAGHGAPEETEAPAKKAPRTRTPKKAEPAAEGTADPAEAAEAVQGSKEAKEAPEKKKQPARKRTAVSKAESATAAKSASKSVSPKAKKVSEENEALQENQAADYVETAVIAAEQADADKDGSLTGDVQFMMGGSKKEAVLALYNEGRSNVDIAKTLGLGIGEVKLVIDLFKGQR